MHAVRLGRLVAVLFAFPAMVAAVAAATSGTVSETGRSGEATPNVIDAGNWPQWRGPLRDGV